MKAYGHFQEAALHLRHVLELRPNHQPALLILKEMESSPDSTVHVYTMLIIGQFYSCIIQFLTNEQNNVLLMIRISLKIFKFLKRNNNKNAKTCFWNHIYFLMFCLITTFYPPCKVGNAWFTTDSLKALSELYINVYSSEN